MCISKSLESTGSLFLGDGSSFGELGFNPVLDFFPLFLCKLRPVFRLLHLHLVLDLDKSLLGLYL
jgi:hypothetical protein